LDEFVPLSSTSWRCIPVRN